MKKSVALALLLCVSLSFNSSVSAETDSTLNLRIEENQTTVTGQVEKREEIRAYVTPPAGARQERRSDFAQNHAERLASHFAGYYNRLNNLVNKIQAKITEVKASGKNTSVAQAKLDAAKATLEEAKTLGEQAVAAFQAIDPAKYGEQRDRALTARDLANKAKETFINTLRNLKATIEALKALRTEE